MKVVIPVAGEGVRMRPLTDAVPKPLLEVAGDTILGHLLHSLEGLPVDELIFVVGFKKEMIVDYVHARTKTKARFVVQEDQPLHSARDKPAGLGYAVNLTLPYVEEGPLLILLGDTVLELDWKPVLQAKENLLGLKEVTEPRRFGIAVLQDGKVAELEEKPQRPKSKFAIVGPYYIREVGLFKKCLAELVAGPPGANGEWQLTDGLSKMIKAGATFWPLWIEGWFDCGKPETLLETNRYLLSRFTKTFERPGATITPPCYIAPSATVESSTIGPFVSIGERAAVRFSTLRNSIISERARVNESVLEDSIVGAGATVSGRNGQVTVGASPEVSVS